MPNLLIQTDPHSLSIDLSALLSHLTLTDAQFYDFCQTNRDLRIERSATGEVIIMSPAFADTGHCNFRLIQQLANWADADGTGLGFDSSAGFTLPNGATRSPDVAWIQLERWNRLSPQQQASFAPICPDFVVELRSASDRLSILQEKLEEYLANGVRLGLLIDPPNRMVYCYRPGQPVAGLDNLTQVNCAPELPGFTVKLAPIWG